MLAFSSKHRVAWQQTAEPDGVEVGVGSLSLVSLGKNSIITARHIGTQVFWQNTGLLQLSLALYSDCDGAFGQSRRISESRCSIGCSALCFLAVETNDLPYVLKLTSGSLTSWAAGDATGWLESSWDRQVYYAPTLPATVSAYRESLV